MPKAPPLPAPSVPHDYVTKGFGPLRYVTAWPGEKRPSLWRRIWEWL